MVGAEIKRLMEVGGLTVADVSHWLDEPRSTIVDWIEGAHPMQYKRANIWVKLDKLRKVIAKSKDGCLVPAHIRLPQRKAYIIKIRNA